MGCFHRATPCTSRQVRLSGHKLGWPPRSPDVPVFAEDRGTAALAEKEEHLPGQIYWENLPGRCLERVSKDMWEEDE